MKVTKVIGLRAISHVGRDIASCRSGGKHCRLGMGDPAASSCVDIGMRQIEAESMQGQVVEPSRKILVTQGGNN